MSWRPFAGVGAVFIIGLPTFLGDYIAVAGFPGSRLCGWKYDQSAILPEIGTIAILRVMVSAFTSRLYGRAIAGRDAPDARTPVYPDGDLSVPYQRRGDGFGDQPPGGLLTFPRPSDPVEHRPQGAAARRIRIAAADLLEPAAASCCTAPITWKTPR